MANHVVARRVERVGIPVLPFACRACLEFIDDEAIDQIVDMLIKLN